MNPVINVLVWATYFIGLYFAIFWLYSFFERYELFREESRGASARKLRRFPKVSVVIPAYNAASTIKDCVLSAASLNYPKGRLEIIVVNDGSADSTAQIVSELIDSSKNGGASEYASIIKLVNQGNMGKGVAVNNGLRLCSGEFFACLDSDSFVEPETLVKMLCVFEQHGHDLSIVTPAMKVFRPKSLLQKLQWAEYLVALFFYRVMSHFDALFVAPGPFSLYRTETVRKLGGFDVHSITEDQEIGYRMQKNCYRLKHCFDAYVYTTVPTTIMQLYTQRSRWWRGSMLTSFKYRSLFLNPRYGHFGVFQLPMILFGYITVWFVAFFFAYFTVWPWWQNFYNLYLVGFDFTTLLKGISISLDVLRYDIGRSLIILTLTAFSITIFLLSHKSAKEALFKQGFLYLPVYFVFYYVLLSFIYVAAAAQLLVSGGKDKWLGKSI